MEIVDLTQTIENGMPFFPGDPEPFLSRAQGVVAPWRVLELRLGSHTGTHIDAPAHYFPDGRCLDRYSPERFILPGVVVTLEVTEEVSVGPRALESALRDVPKGGALILYTGWDRFWGRPEYSAHPYLSREACEAIVAAGVSLVAVDALNVDSTRLGTCHAHEVLLGNDVLIVENLRGLGQLDLAQRYTFAFVPLRIAGADGAPIRALAWPRQKD
ncbi:MAG: cyclase family protein [Chloroflexia bacterium]